MDNDKLTKMYRDALERAKGYMDDETLYHTHLYYCLKFAELLGIDEKKVLQELQQEVERRKLKL